MDIRDSGYKLAPIDTNIFPGGFNNINKEKYPQISKMIEASLSKYPQSSNILIIPESHTRNQFYLNNVESLKSIVELTGRRVEVSNLSVEDLEKRDTKLAVKSSRFTPDIIILNNDLSSGAPEILKDIEQPIIPDLRFCWYLREKSKHFAKYDEVISSFCKEFGLDKFFLSAISYSCDEVNFLDSKGLDRIANYVEKLMRLLGEKYKEHGINHKPYAFIKADKGTYGMGIMTTRSGEEVSGMNRKLKKKMHAIKEGLINTKVIIQEGIPTITEYNGKTAEPIVYLIGDQVADCFLRVNSQKSKYDNLNRSGLEFAPLTPDISAYHNIDIYSLVARLASLGAANE